jgi:hypothetical protein
MGSGSLVRQSAIARRGEHGDLATHILAGQRLPPTHYAINALICHATTEADIDPTGSSSNAPSVSSADSPTFPPDNRNDQ